jgi:hypothetical protein
VFAGLHIDPNSQQMQAALNDAMSAKNRPPAGEGNSSSSGRQHQSENGVFL